MILMLCVVLAQLANVPLSPPSPTSPPPLAYELPKDRTRPHYVLSNRSDHDKRRTFEQVCAGTAYEGDDNCERFLGDTLVTALLDHTSGLGLAWVPADDANELRADDADAGDDCLPLDPSFERSVCGVHINHPVEISVARDWAQRDADAESHLAFFGSSNLTTTSQPLDVLLGSSPVCQSALQQAVCLAQFPPCNSSNLTACLGACEAVNLCAREVGLPVLCSDCMALCAAPCATDTTAGDKGGLEAAQMDEPGSPPPPSGRWLRPWKHVTFIVLCTVLGCAGCMCFVALVREKYHTADDPVWLCFAVVLLAIATALAAVLVIKPHVYDVTAHFNETLPAP